MKAVFSSFTISINAEDAETIGPVYRYFRFQKGIESNLLKLFIVFCFAHFSLAKYSKNLKLHNRLEVSFASHCWSLS